MKMSRGYHKKNKRNVKQKKKSKRKQNEVINEQVTLQTSMKNIWKINQKSFTMLRRKKRETA